MRYAKEHKERRRQQILEVAAPAFRAEGVAGVGIGELMGRLGLTHGGFYAHFASKDDLVAAACARGLAESAERLQATVAGTPPGEELTAVIRSYLSRRHRDTPADGCPMPALAGDVARQPPAVRHAFTGALADYLDRLAALLPDRPGADPRDDALVLAAGLAGAVLLARAVDDPVLSDRLLRAARAFYTDAFVAGDTTAPASDGGGDGGRAL